MIVVAERVNAEVIRRGLDGFNVVFCETRTALRHATFADEQHHNGAWRLLTGVFEGAETGGCAMTNSMDFSAEKSRLLTELNILNEHLAAAEQATEVDLADMRHKLAHARSAVAAERFSIALFGAFSDGKTTIANALLGRSDLLTGPEPTTDVVTKFASGDYVIVDTPGLFPVGLKHEERTRKYISEANLILFVLPPQNPLKDSHREVVAWLLNDLGKLCRRRYSS